MDQILLLVGVLILAPVLYYLYRQSGWGGGSVGINSGSILAKYSRDLTRLAVEKKLDPVIGRDHEISRVVEILSRRTKNNPVLVGAAGVGKTAVAEGLALRIVAKQVPNSLYGKKVLALDLTGILAGTKYRGEFEQRLKKITDEIIAAKRVIILFIDEIHILAEAGVAEGAINAADILKPLLARGELQVVGATTKDEYLKFIKQDKTLDRRLQPVFVSEPTAAQTEQILQGIKAIYEKYHKVIITPSAIKTAVTATKAIKGRSYPDKAIDAIDEACSRVHIENLAAAGKKPLRVTDQDIRKVVREWLVNN
ncbi:MAG: AAA family ATPase [Patescibacteria group bacterium]|jgi:ATP-dependent Clp protease ATP-binding subunit ClpC